MANWGGIVPRRRCLPALIVGSPAPPCFQLPSWSGLWERREERGSMGLCSQRSVSGKQSRAWPLVRAGGRLLAQKGQTLVIIQENIQPSRPNEPPGCHFPATGLSRALGTVRGERVRHRGSHTQQSHTGGEWDRTGAGREKAAGSVSCGQSLSRP